MKYLIKKSITLIITLLTISMLTFLAFSVVPGDASLMRAGTDATPEQLAQIREDMGLDLPLPVRYVNWLKAALQGDFGYAYQYSNTTVAELLAGRLPATLLLAILAFLLILVISIPLGLICARYEGRFADHLINQLTQVTMAVPAFFLGIVMTYLFGLVLKWFRPGAYISPQEDFRGCISYLLFPAIAVALPRVAMVVKFLRNSVLNEMKKDYVRTAYSKGSRKDRVLYMHVLKNAMIPVITFLAMVVAEILAGSIIVEQVFSVPGMGRLLTSSISTRDYPVVQAVVLYITAIVVMINFIVDILYKTVDPRVKL